MDKFQNKYRIPSSRLRNWDYGSPGFYFITVCTKNRKHYFGEIINDEMHTDTLGSLVNAEWIKTPGIRPDMNLELGEFVVMPNHFHGIMMIGENEFNRRDVMPRVSIATIPANPTTAQNKFGPQSKKFRFHHAWFQIFDNYACKKIKP